MKVCKEALNSSVTSDSDRLQLLVYPNFFSHEYDYIAQFESSDVKTELVSRVYVYPS